MDRIEALGPAERIVEVVTSFQDHVYHGRCGIISPDARTRIGVRWEPVIWVQEGNDKVVYKVEKPPHGKQIKTRLGTLQPDNKVISDRKTIGEYRKPGIFPESAAWYYKQVADVYQMDNEFVARWGSWQWTKESKDLKVILAAFLLVQNRSGAPVGNPPEFYDDDFRAVGEAMCLLRGKSDIDPKQLLRVGDVLSLPQVADINRTLGFGHSTRNPSFGRYKKVVEKYLNIREQNPSWMKSLVEEGWCKSLKKLAQRIGYKPLSPRFFELLRWKQKQSEDGRRQIFVTINDVETWEGMTEGDICQTIVDHPVSWKRIVGMIPPHIGMTRAIVAAAIEAGCLSDTDLMIAAPTLEKVGLLAVPDIRNRVQTAITNAAIVTKTQRGANIAKRMRSEKNTEMLQASADVALKEAVKEVVRGLNVYVLVDISGSMTRAIPVAKQYLAKFLQAFPLEKLHVAVFNTTGREVAIKTASANGVEQAFRGLSANGGTDYAEGFRAISHHKPGIDEDAIVIIVGDEGQANNGRFAKVIRESGINPVGFWFIKLPGDPGNVVQATAKELGIACRVLNETEAEQLFSDAYALPRVLRETLNAMPVQARVAKKSLVKDILETDLLEKPVWA